MYRIVVADDEIIECKALEMMLGNDFPELEILPSVYNGADLIAAIEKYKPDIAIVDINMPQLNGLDALELIRARNQQMKIIISSAYSDFTYVKRAMKLGAFDYILKPLEKDVFEETLTKVIAALQLEHKKADQEQENQEHLGEMTHAVGTEFLSSLMLGEPDEKSFAIYQRSLKREYNGGILVCCRMAGDGFENGYPYGKNKEVLIENVLAGMNQYCNCVGKWNRGELYFLLLVGSQVSKTGIEQWMKDIIGMLKAKLEQLCKPEKFICGVSTWKYDSTELAAGLAESRIAARGQNTPGIYYYKAIGKTGSKKVLKGVEEKCRRFLRTGKVKECLEEIHEAFKGVDEQEEDLMHLQAETLGFMLLLYEDTNSGRDYLSKYSKGTKLELSLLSECKNKEDLENWCRDCVEKFSVKIRSGEKKSREYVERTLIFMEQNYMEDISLEDAAENSGISSFYLSRLLKQELHQTFVEILTDIRMQRAMNLLIDENNTVREVAEKSGYNNITYFYKVFKKYTGMNISELRERMK